jgi:hypothetical protein
MKYHSVGKNSFVKKKFALIILVDAIIIIY